MEKYLNNTIHWKIKMPMEISIIASGSNGNSCLVENNNSSVLIDAGKSCKEIEYRMSKLGKNLENVDGILLTHSHIDHFIGVGPISRKYNIPVYLTKEVYNLSKHKIGEVEKKHFSINSSFKVKNLEIKPIITSHDVPSCGFAIQKFGIFTDTGIITPEMGNCMDGLKGVLLESNHDIDMLINGSYPEFLKQRIFSDNGHLSNINASDFIRKYGKNLSWALLAHLSAKNNTPEKAKATFETIVNRKIDFSVLSRDKESGSWNL